MELGTEQFADPESGTRKCAMTDQPLAIKTDDLTVGRLGDWLDKVRSAGAVDDQPIGLEATGSEGNPIAAHDIFVEIDQ